MEQFGRYQLLRKLGAGGMAEVYLARTPLAQGLHKQLVIKKIHPAYAQNPQFRIMLRREAEAAMNLNHPNIAQVFEWGEKPSHYLAMEYVEGVDLMTLSKHATERGRRFGYGLAAYIVQQLASGLDYAHRKTDPKTGDPLGIVHRDISPQNILISFDGGVKIVDFGIAALAGVPEERGMVKGKYAYMSPEQAEARPLDRRSDVYSAGIVLYELATGKPLYGTLKGTVALQALRMGTVAEPRSADPKIPAELEEIITTALARDPAARYQTARDLAKPLGRFFFAEAARGEAIDASTLAAFVARTIPPELRDRTSPSAVSQETPATSPRPSSVATASRTTGSHHRLGASEVRARERRQILLIEGELGGLAELRQEVGEARARAALSDFLRVAENIAYKQRAHPQRIDEQGLTMVIGLPGAGEDDASRAIRVARDLIEAIEAISRDVQPPLSIGIGVLRGVADVIWRTSGFEHTLVGEAGPVAKRLAHEAMAGEILVAGAVYRVSRDEWHFDALDLDVTAAHPDDSAPSEPRSPKVYRVRGPKERRERMALPTQGPDALIGRSEELAALTEAWQATTRQKEAHSVAILGEAGLGKRSLVAAFLAGLQAPAAQVLRARARPAVSQAPFALVADLLRDLVGLGDQSEPREIRRGLERLATSLYPEGRDAPEARELVAIFGALLGIRVPYGAAPEQPASERPRRIFQALDRLEERLSRRRPLIVVVEDTHFGDAPSLELLHELSSRGRKRPVLGIITARSAPEIRRLLAGFPPETRRILQLSELRGGQAEALLERRFAGDAAAKPVIEQLIARAGGNPFYLQELVESLLERGLVQADGDRLFVVQVPEKLQIPSTVEAVVASRLDALPAAQKEALTRAAVLGPRIVPAALAQILGRDVADELDRLVARGLLDRDDKGGYAFHNQIIHEVAYERLPEEEKREIHQRAARLLADRPDPAPAMDDAAIARHAAAAGDYEEAVRRYLMAARAAREIAGNRLALDYLLRARKLLGGDDHQRKFEIASLCEQMLRDWGRRTDQVRHIHAMRRAAEALGDRGRLAQALARMALFDYEVGRIPRADRACVWALAEARAAGDRGTEIEALRIQALVYHRLGRTSDALGAIKEALDRCGLPPGEETAERRELLLLRAAVSRTRGTILRQTGNFRGALDAYGEAMVIYRRLGVRAMEAAALNNLGDVSIGLGEYEEALGYYQQSLAIDQEIGNLATLGFKLANIGQAYLDVGDLERSERYLRKALELHEALGEEPHAAPARITLGELHYRRNEAKAARTELERGLELARGTSNRFEEVRALWHLARAHVAAGTADAQVLELAKTATRLAREAAMAPGQAWGLTAEAQVLAALGRTEEAIEQSGRAVELASSAAAIEGREEILLTHAQLLGRAGRAQQATDFIARAYEEVQHKGRLLRSPEWRERYLASSVARAVMEAWRRGKA